MLLTFLSRVADSSPRSDKTQQPVSSACAPGLAISRACLAPMARKSGLQHKVLALYRRALVTAKRKDAVEDQGFTSFVRSEFRFQVRPRGAGPGVRSARRFSPCPARQARAVPRRDFQRIEYLIRKGEKQLRTLGNEHVEGVRVAHMVDNPKNPTQGE